MLYNLFNRVTNLTLSFIVLDISFIKKFKQTKYNK